MPDALPTRNGDIHDEIQSESTGSGSTSLITAETFSKSFGEDIRDVLDLGTWRIGADMGREYSRIEHEVRQAVTAETEFQKEIRTQIFPRLKARENAPKHAGTHCADRKLIEKIHQEF